jgi:uncharacterized membrane protein YvbJ
MQCRQCGTEIADKALICYRCGTATTEAKYQPAALRRSSSRSTLVATVLALALLVVFALYMGRVAGGDSSRLASYGAVAIAVILVGLRAYVRRRR